MIKDPFIYQIYDMAAEIYIPIWMIKDNLYFKIFN